MVEAGFSSYCRVDVHQEFFANSPDLAFGRVNKTASGFVLKVVFVVFECDKSLSFSHTFCPVGNAPKYIWKLCDNNQDFNIKWTIISRARPYNNISKRCDLCLTEKLKINYYKPRQNPKQKIRTDFQVPPRKQVLSSEQLTQKQYSIKFFSHLIVIRTTLPYFL